MFIEKYLENDFSEIFEQFFCKPKKLVLKALILAQLLQKESHGYNIMKKIEENTMKKWKPSHSMIYGVLSELEKNKLITSKEDKKGGVKLKLYKITKKGREELEKLSFALIKLFDFSEQKNNSGYPIIERLVNDAITSLKLLPKDEQIERLNKIKQIAMSVIVYVDSKISELKGDFVS
ncbi:MAG: PadR family transcriptional regulator [Candidatus Odinarchaeia archaeon]